MQDISTLFQRASRARLKAYAPYSHFLVGSCIETKHGHLFDGCNVENAAYGATICAESNAIGSMITAGETSILQIAVVVNGPGVSAPCGICRQRIFEFSTPETRIHLLDLNDTQKTLTINELLPLAFGPKDLTKE